MLNVLKKCGSAVRLSCTEGKRQDPCRMEAVTCRTDCNIWKQSLPSSLEGEVRKEVFLMEG